MIAYYGYTISPNMLETCDGFLICRNVPIARTGEMEYLESELKQDGGSSKIVTVCRSPDEVFSEAALSSFEGKPVTDEHPPELLTPETYSIYAKGHAQNIRRGTGEWEGHVMADLHIQDEGLIQAVQDGKREISCGYECSYTENGDGTYSQHDIRGNHIAVVTRGRAGKQVAILDSKKTAMAKRPERKGNMKNNLFFKLFAKAARDASPEELETMAADAAEALAEVPGEKESSDKFLKKEDLKKEENKKSEAEDACSTDSKLNALMDAITKLIGEKEAQEPAEDALDSLIKEMSGEDDAPAGEAKVIPAEEVDKAKGAADKAVMVEVIKKLRPVVAAIKDSTDRRKVTDSLISCMTDKAVMSDISKIMQTTQKNAAVMADQKPGIDLDAYQAAYDAMNPHKNGGKN